MPTAIKKVVRFIKLVSIAALALIALNHPLVSHAGERFKSHYPCKTRAKTCIDRGSKIIDDEAVHRDCWKYSYVTVCDYPSLDNCSQYSHCYFVQVANCLLTDFYGNCVNQKKEFSCKRWIPEIVQEKNVRIDLVEREGQDGLVCKGIPCIDGNCFDKSWRTNGEMMDSMSKLYATSQMKNGGDLNFKLFAGTNQQCSKKATSYSNCCSESQPGWGRNIGANCTQDERTLIENRKKNLCVYVGKQNKQTLGVTTVVKHQFCCFGNMLDKVIQVEGRKQLNNRATDNFGNGSNPDCRGLTLQEIQRIDFSKLDFSEFIEDFKVKFFGKYKQPSSADISARVTGSMSNIRRYDDNPNNPQNNLTGWSAGLKDDSYEADEERRLEQIRQAREAERLESERRRQLEESEGHKRRLEEEQRQRAAQEVERQRLLAVEAQKRAERRKPLEDKIKELDRYMAALGDAISTERTVSQCRWAELDSISAYKIYGDKISRVWARYKNSPLICDLNYLTAYYDGYKHFPPDLIKYRDAFIAWSSLTLSRWCEWREQKRKIENDLSSGNY